MLKTRVLTATVGVLLGLMVGGCASEAAQDVSTAEQVQTVPETEPAAQETIRPSDAEYDALRRRLTDSTPGIQSALDAAIDEGDFSPMYDAATDFLDIGPAMVRKIEETPELDPEGTDLALIIATYDVVDATIGELHDRAVDGRLIYIDNYPDGKNADEYERWLVVNGYR